MQGVHNCMSIRRAKIAVFVSGNGTNMKAIHRSCQQGKINADISVVVSDKPNCNAVMYAMGHEIPVIKYPDASVNKNELIEKLIGIGRTKRPHSHWYYRHVG